MTIGGFIRGTSISGAAVLLMAAGAYASVVTYSTNAPETGFGGISLALNNSAGAAATLTFIPNVNVTTGVPSNVNFGNFTLVCPSCTTQAGGAGSVFPSLPFQPDHHRRHRRQCDRDVRGHLDGRHCIQ